MSARDIRNDLADALVALTRAHRDMTAAALPDHQRDTISQIKRSVERLVEEMNREQARWDPEGAVK